jgi:poly-gamma-glutamate system protein
MKKVYWRPTRVPRAVLMVIAFLSIAGIFSIELFKVQKKQPYYKEKLEAAHTMRIGMDIIKQYRIENIGPIDREVDPANSGIIGLPASIITTSVGHLPAKQTTVNPNWAAVMVDMLRKVEVKEGDVIAMGLSGSFPAMNIACYAAARALKMEVISISSVGASTWGANIPDLTWLDMERVLFKAGVSPYRSVLATLGGEGDKAMGTSKKTFEALKKIIQKNELQILKFGNVEENIEERMNTYQEFAQGKSIGAYINIGGGRASVGPRIGKKRYQPGLNIKPPLIAMKMDSVTTRFARTGVPVIHIYRIDELAETYGLPISPLKIPKVGSGHIFSKQIYNLPLVTVCLILLLLVSHLFLKMDIGYRIFGSAQVTETPKHPEPMV